MATKLDTIFDELAAERVDAREQDQLAQDMGQLQERTTETKEIKKKPLLPARMTKLGDLIEPEWETLGGATAPTPAARATGVPGQYNVPALDKIAQRKQRELSGEAFPITPELNAATAPGPKASWDESVVDFMFGGEMSIVGLKYDNGMITHDWEIAKKQWSEAPLWENVLNTISLGSYAIPLAQAARLSMKMGKLGRILGRLPSKADDIDFLKAAGKIDPHIKVGDLSDADIRKLKMQVDSTTDYVNYKSKIDMLANGDESAKLSMVERGKMKFKQMFGNSYMDITDAASKGDESLRSGFNRNLNELWRREDLGRLFINMPDVGVGDVMPHRFYEHFLAKQGVKGARSTLKGAELKWADGMEAAMRAHTQEAIESGFVTPEMVARVGELHIPAQKVGTPIPDTATSRSLFLPMKRKATKAEIEAGVAGADDTIMAMRSFDMPRLDSKTMLRRKADLPEVYQKMVKGEIMTDPFNMTTRGYVMDRLLINNYKTVVDLATKKGWGANMGDVIAKYGSVDGAAKKGWVSLENLDGAIPDTLRRMIKKRDPSALGVGDELPMMRKEAFEELFGKDGMFAQTQHTVNLFEALVSIHKTAKTGYSIPTHLQNIVSNIAMLAQRGFNITSPTNTKLAGQMGKAFGKMNQHLKAKKAMGPYSLSKAAREGTVQGLHLGKIKVRGKMVDLDELFTDPRVLALVEESSFEMAEGHARMAKMLEALGDQKGLTARVLRGYQKVENLANKKFNVFNKLSEAYLAEDMIPKMTYLADLKARGFSTEAAIIEVGRSLPMYSTVGSTVRGARKYIFPWASFPVEAARITKNNIMEHPLRMLPWLHAPSIFRSVLGVSGMGPETRAIAESEQRNLPLWAQRSTTVMASQGLLQKVGAPAGGAATGGLLGGVFGGTTGAAAGAAVGAAAGIAYNTFSEQEDAEHMRGVMLDWLPHSPWTLNQVSPEATGDVLPWDNWQQMAEQSPVGKPMSILWDMQNIIQGKNAYGQELKAEGMTEKGMHMIAGMIGFLSPPMLQKYAFTPGKTPDISLAEMAIGGGHTTRAIDPTNVSRLGIDTGLTINPVTGRPGSLTFDFFMNNFGAIKSFAADPSNRIFNEDLKNQRYSETRSYAAKNLRAYLENGMDDEAVGILRMANASFAQQYSDSPQMAARKYNEWLKTFTDSIGRHPRMKGQSKEEIQDRLDQVNSFSEEMRGRTRHDTIKLLLDELKIRSKGGYKKYGNLEQFGRIGS